MHDALIANGLVVDGTGGAPRHADVAIRAGVIVAVGHDLGAAREVIDASQCVVTPGFVDPHTHLDAQLFWDSAATPSCLHGVTTVAISACGFGVAPCARGDRDYVLRSLEVVEEIPFESTAVGVPDAWNTWPEYADALAALPLGVNVASFVPHSPLRRAVLGTRARLPTLDDDDIRRVVSAYSAALDAGALGFATSRGKSHVDAAGEPMPSRLASDRELAALVAASRSRAWQIATEATMTDPPSQVGLELDRYAEWTTASDARLSWAPLVASDGSNTWRDALNHTLRLRDLNCAIVAQVTPRPIAVTLCLSNNSSYRAQRIVGWERVFQDFPHDGSIEQRTRFLTRPEVRSALSAAGSSGSELMSPRFERWRLACSPTQPDSTGLTLAEVFEGHPDPVLGLIELLLRDDLGTVVEIPVANDSPDLVAELCSADGVLFGLGDSGAHVASITSYSYPTFVLSSFVRDQQAMLLEEAVHRLTSAPARHLGITDRGELRPGQAADTCVVDLAALRARPAELRSDLPGGQTRLVQAAFGYRAVLVNGEVTVRNDELSDATPGRFLRV